MSSSDQFPVIDLTGTTTDPAVLAALTDACTTWGFFQVVHHGIPPELMAKTHTAMRAFFALQTASKRAIERTPDNAWGFFDRELTKNVRDWKEVYDYGPEGGSGAARGNRAQWPAELPSFRPAVEAFYSACEGLAFRLLAGIATSLGMPVEVMAEGFGPGHTSFLRFNFYPACDDSASPDAEGHLGVNHHTDAGAITILLQDEQPGLQVLHDGAWVLVEPRPDALVVNIGDIVQVWSNDRYRAAIHRVITNRTRDRYSAPFFFNPRYEASYAPMASVCGPENPPRYRPINWGEFRARRLAGDNADLGDEVQIAHYRTA